MKITRYGHSCVLVEDGAARLLLDPGVFSQGFEGLEGLTGVLITHQHADHLDHDRLVPLLAKNPEAKLVCDDGSVAVLQGLPHIVAKAGDHLDLGTPVVVHGQEHAVIHVDYPVIPNIGYFIGGRFFTPGDAFTVPEEDVEILGAPTAAPWMKLAEAVAYLRAVKPHIAFPLHDGVLSAAATEMWFHHLGVLGPERTHFTPVRPGESL